MFIVQLTQPLLLSVSFFVFLITVNHYYSNKLCVSASQDGKLIVWDSITTNKVGKSKGKFVMITVIVV